MVVLGATWSGLGVNPKRSTAINGESSSSSSLSAKYPLFTAFQIQNNVGISKSRVTSIFCSFSTTTASNNSSNLNWSDSDSSFVVSYLINSCGLSENQAITASKSVNFKTATKPDSVLTLLKSYGFTESHISKLINKRPTILSSNPHKTLKPRLDFFQSKGIDELDLATFISNYPTILRRSLNKDIIPSFEKLKSIVHSDQNVITIIRRESWLLRTTQVKRVMVNLELLRNEGVPESNIVKYLIQQPRVFTGDADSFKEVVEKVRGMGFNDLESRFLIAIRGFTSMTEANWRKKMDVYKRWGWSEDQIQKAFRKSPSCMMTSENKIMEVMNFLVNEMGFHSSSVAENPIVFCCSLKKRITPRCSVIKILVSKGLKKEMISLSTLSTMVDEYFLKNFVIKYEQQVPELMKVFQGQLNYQQLLQN